MILLQKISDKNAISGSPDMFGQISLSLKPLWKRILSFSWRFTHEIMPKFSPREHCSLGISSNPEDVFSSQNFLSFQSEIMRGQHSFSSMLTLLNKSLITRLESQDMCLQHLLLVPGMLLSKNNKHQISLLLTVFLNRNIKYRYNQLSVT